MATEVSEGSSPKRLKRDQEVFAEDPVVSTRAAALGFTDNVPMSPVNSSVSGSQTKDDPDDDFDSSYSDEYILSNYHDNALYHDEDCSYDNLISLQAQLDSEKIPAGVEICLPCLGRGFVNQNPADLSTSIVPSKLNSQSNKEKKENLEAESIPNPSQSRSCKEEEKLAATSNSTVSSQPGSTRENEVNDEVGVLGKFRLFKKFDTVQDYSDHHFTHGDSKPKQAPQMWKRTIQQEWKILEKDLPATIFVRVYEERIDLLRAVIVGTPGTPYHDSLFFFDFFFPSDYPNVPPKVFYYSGGLRLNRNLSVCGKVCLSLLNTWPEKGDEKWTPGKSTVLQILLSIQALVLNEKTYFNEPGFEQMADRHEGEVESKGYNKDTFILSCMTMLYTLSRPPKHYEDFVAGYFHLHAHKILKACKAYVEGAQVGCLSGLVQDRDEQTKGGSQKFKEEVSNILPRLVQAFTRNGAKDCEQFLPANK